MSKVSGSGKSCGPQLFKDGEPNNEWGLDELSFYAKMQHRQIIDGEKLLTPSYWRLGHALVLAKRALNHGQWTRYLQDLGIDKTRASRARAIYRTFAKEEDLAGLTVEQAYARRESRQPAQPNKGNGGTVKTQKDVLRLRKSISLIAKWAEEVIHDAAFAPREEAVILVPAVRRVVDRLQEVLGYLEEQAGATPHGYESGSEKPVQSAC